MSLSRNPAPEKCAKCGACTTVCPVYQVTGKESHTARGRLHLFTLLENNASRAYADILSQCLLCGACSDACPRGIDIPAKIRNARHDLPDLAGPLHFKKLLTKKALSSPNLLEGLGTLHKNLLVKLPKESGLRKVLPFHGISEKEENHNFPSLHESEALPDAQLSYFAGCMASYLVPEIQSATLQLAERATGSPPAIPADQSCCGLASYSSGDLKEARKLAQRNITAFADSALPILTSCASCYSHLSNYPELFADDPDWSDAATQFASRLYEFSSFFLDNLEELPFAANQATADIFYHDPCHLRFSQKKTITPPRSLIKAATGHSPLELPHGPQCCGNGGLFSLAHGDLSRQILQPLIHEISELSACQVVTTCSGCLLQLMKGKKSGSMQTKVRHLSILLNDLLK